MVTHPNGDDAPSPVTGTRYFTGTIPSEILLNIIEQCDLHTLLKCQKLNRAINQLITLFSDQIVKSVSSRELYYRHPLFTQGRPDRLTVAYLRHIHTAHLFCMKLCMKHFAQDFVDGAMRERIFPKQKRMIETFLNQLHHGCKMALRLISARIAGEKAFIADEGAHSKTFDRKMTSPWRLEKHIEMAQQDVVKNSRPMDVLHFKLFWSCRAGAITPPGRFTTSRTDDRPVHSLQNRSVRRKEVQDPRDLKWNIWTKHWASGFLLDLGLPSALIFSFRLETDPGEASQKAFQTLIRPMSDRYSRMSYEARRAHLERAHRILESMEAVFKRSISTLRAQHTGPALNQKHQEHNLKVLTELAQFLRHLQVPGHTSSPRMSSRPFAETIEPLAA